MDFLTGSSTLNAIGKKYARGLSEQYETVHHQYIESIAEQKLRILSEIEAAENAVIILNAYVFRRYKFHPDNKPRRISGLFTSEFNGTKIPLLEEQEVCKGFKAFIFSIRSNVYNYAPSGGLLLRNLKQDGLANWLLSLAQYLTVSKHYIKLTSTQQEE